MSQHKIGGHVSVAKGLELAPQRGHDIGANAIQIFAYSNEQFAQFKEATSAFSINVCFFMGCI